MIYSEPILCQFNLAAKYLARLPWNLFLLGTPINQVLVEPLSWHPSAADASDEFCGNVAEFMSLAFEERQFQLPTFHSAKVLAEETWEQGSPVCFEELTVVPRASSFGTVRHVAEAADLRRLSFARCNLHSLESNFLEGEWVRLNGRPKVLMLEHWESRYILNSSELCLGLRPTCESRLLQRPEAHSFCPHARAAHWADIIVMRTGAHVDYASIAARRGTVVIVVYAYPLLLQRIDVLRTLWQSELHLLDMVLMADDPIDESRLSTVMGPLTADFTSLCSQADFATILYFPHCQNYFSFNDTSVSSEALAPYIMEALSRISSTELSSLLNFSAGAVGVSGLLR